MPIDAGPGPRPRGPDRMRLRRRGQAARRAGRPGRGPAPSGTQDAAARGPVRLLRLGNFDAPTFLASPRGDSRRFVVQRGGDDRDRARPQEAGPALPRHLGPRLDRRRGGPALDGLRAQLQGAPGSSTCTTPIREGFIQIDQYRRSSDPNRADPNSRRSVIRVPHFRTNHKGGQLEFGPDGMLYAGFGDGGSGGDPDENAQNLGRILGKLIRIDPRPGGGYDIPRSNPFVNRAGARGRDLRLRAAQPLPLLVRPQARVARDRRRRPGRGRGDRLRAQPAAAAASRAAATTSAGTASRAAIATRPAAPRGTYGP